MSRLRVSVFLGLLSVTMLSLPSSCGGNIMGDVVIAAATVVQDGYDTFTSWAGGGGSGCSNDCVQGGGCESSGNYEVDYSKKGEYDVNANVQIKVDVQKEVCVNEGCDDCIDYSGCNTYGVGQGGCCDSNDWGNKYKKDYLEQIIQEYYRDCSSWFGKYCSVSFYTSKYEFYYCLKELRKYYSHLGFWCDPGCIQYFKDFYYHCFHKDSCLSSDEHCNNCFTTWGDETMRQRNNMLLTYHYLYPNDCEWLYDCERCEYTKVYFQQMCNGCEYNTCRNMECFPGEESGCYWRRMICMYDNCPTCLCWYNPSLSSHFWDYKSKQYGDEGAFVSDMCVRGDLDNEIYIHKLSCIFHCLPDIMTKDCYCDYMKEFFTCICPKKDDECDVSHFLRFYYLWNYPLTCSHITKICGFWFKACPSYTCFTKCSLQDFKAYLNEDQYRSFETSGFFGRNIESSGCTPDCGGTGSTFGVSISVGKNSGIGF